MARYFVTGATGFVGGRLAAQLRQAEHQVVAIARDPSRTESLQALGVDVRRGDVLDPASLAEPMTGCDGVFHLAGWYKIGVRSAKMGERINVDGTHNVLECMRRLRIGKGVYTSTLAVHGNTRGEIGGRNAPLQRAVREPLRPQQVARALRGRRADDARGPAARDRHAGPGLRSRRHEQRAHDAHPLPHAPAAAAARVERLLLGARGRRRARPRAGDGTRPGRRELSPRRPSATLLEALRSPNGSPASRGRAPWRRRGCCARCRR